MSVNRIDYVIFGVNVGYDNVSYEQFEAEICGEPDRRFDIIYDGMSGNYAYAGKIVARSDQYEGFGDGVSLKPTDESTIAAMMEVRKAFPDLTLPFNDFTYFAVSHFG